jgi:hypothetical protein
MVYVTWLIGSGESASPAGYITYRVRSAEPNPTTGHCCHERKYVQYSDLVRALAARHDTVPRSTKPLHTRESYVQAGVDLRPYIARREQRELIRIFGLTARLATQSDQLISWLTEMTRDIAAVLENVPPPAESIARSSVVQDSLIDQIVALQHEMHTALTADPSIHLQFRVLTSMRRAADTWIANMRDSGLWMRYSLTKVRAMVVGSPSKLVQLIQQLHHYTVDPGFGSANPLVPAPVGAA